MTSVVPNSRNARRETSAVLLSYATFVLVGIASGGTGVLLVAQMSDYGVDKTTIGLTFFAVSAGYVLAGFTAGWLIHRSGIRVALTAGGVLFTLSGLYLAAHPPFAVFVLVQVVTGFGLGVLESVLNVYLAGLPGATTLLNRLHAFFGVGALIGPVLASRIVAVASWRAVWLVMALACVPLTAGFLVAYRGIAPDQAAAGEGTGGAGAAPADAPGRGLLRAALLEPGVLLGAAMLAVYCGVELGVGNWGFSYLVQGRSMSGALAGYAISGYWLAFTVGRFLISPVAAKLGVSTAGLIYGCLAASAAATVAAWLAPTTAVTCAALALLGFFLGPIFPTTIAIAARLAPARLVPTAIGVMNSVAVFGASALPWVAGAIAQRTGIWTLLPYALTLALLQFAFWLPIAKRIR